MNSLMGAIIDTIELMIQEQFTWIVTKDIRYSKTGVLVHEQFAGECFQRYKVQIDMKNQKISEGEFSLRIHDERHFCTGKSDFQACLYLFDNHVGHF